MDTQRYNQVLRATGLDIDISTFRNGDQTVIGENAKMLSGGQKQRLALARAVYSPASILLLDDCLSAVDPKTAQLLLQYCISPMSELSRGRTVVLVTHSLVMCFPFTDWLIKMMDGKIEAQGTLRELAEQGILEVNTPELIVRRVVSIGGHDGAPPDFALPPPELEFDHEAKTKPFTSPASSSPATSRPSSALYTSKSTGAQGPTILLETEPDSSTKAQGDVTGTEFGNLGGGMVGGYKQEAHRKMNSFVLVGTQLAKDLDWFINATGGYWFIAVYIIVLVIASGMHSLYMFTETLTPTVQAQAQLNSAPQAQAATTNYIARLKCRVQGIIDQEDLGLGMLIAIRFVVTLVHLASNAAHSILREWATYRAEQKISHDVVDRLIHASPDVLDHTPTVDLYRNFDNDLYKLADSFISSLSTMFTAIAEVVTLVLVL
ncbi:hypothetical protein EV182_005668, partial [Spiromyces aspiralis]